MHRSTARRSPRPTKQAQVPFDSQLTAASLLDDPPPAPPDHHPLGDGPQWLRRPLWLAINAALRIKGRQMQVLDGLLREMNVGEIAGAIGLPPDTVETYIERLCIKCRCRSQAGIYIALLRMAFGPVPLWRLAMKGATTR